jgi:CTP:molybdopterin cytidylyltransferase MocA
VTTAGLLLAAGAGRRMGGPKALVRPDPGGPTLLETAVDRLRAAGLDRVVVVVGAAAADTAPLAEALGTEVVVAHGWEEGMGASLRAGLEHLSAGTAEVDAALVTLVDLLDVGPEVHRRVLEAAGTEHAHALARATYSGRPGHPVLLGREHWAGVVESATGDQGARHHLASHGVLEVDCADLAGGEDADTPDALPPRARPGAGDPSDRMGG